MATLPFKFKPSETYSLDTTTKPNNQLRDPSFSSYLNAASEQNVVHRLAQTTRPNNLSFSFKPQDFLDLHLYLGRKEDDHGEEIGVFGAEKYFSGAMDSLSPKAKANNPPMMKLEAEEKEPEQKQGQDIVVVEPTTKPTLLHVGTTSIVSESSMNSHSVLLRRTDPPRKKANYRVCGRSFQLMLSALIGCKCSCADVDHKNVASSTPTKTRTTEEISESSWSTLPVSNNPWISEEETMNKHDKFRNLTAVRAQSPTEQPNNPRKYLEVFGSPSSGNMEEEEEEKKRNNTRTREETNSDASLDLFEIESLTGKVDSYLTRQTTDDATSDCLTTARYAPSEASIEWSVITASAADFSLMSDFEDVNNLSNRTNDMKLRQKVIKNGGADDNVPRRPWSGGSNFLWCKSQKAVEVAGDALRSVSRRFQPEERIVSRDQVQRGSSGLAFSDVLARFQAETRLIGFGLKNVDYPQEGMKLKI